MISIRLKIVLNCFTFFSGIVGAAALYGVVPEGKRGDLGTPKHALDVTAAGAFGCELVLTFLLMFVVFACTDPKRHHYGYEAALAIGVCVAVGNVMGVNETEVLLSSK